MRTTLRWKVAALLSLALLVGLFSVYPLVAWRFGWPAPDWLTSRRLKLGLDLMGGVHLLVKVESDDRARPDAEPETTDARRARLANLREDARAGVLRRVNGLGLSDATVVLHGAGGDRLLIELPGFTDVDRAKALIQSAGHLELRLVVRGPAAEADALRDANRSDAEILPAASASASEAPPGGYYLVEQTAVITGGDLRTARAGIDHYGRHAINFTLSSDGARRFAEATAANVGRELAIVLDDRVLSAPTIESRIEREGQIFGNFTAQQAADLAVILRSGTMPARLTYLEDLVIGATLGADSIRSGVLASFMGLVLVASFMVAYYKWSGANAVVALSLNLLLLLGFMAYLGAVMTLPGIAGFLLTIGMGIDSNVLIFERIKEELTEKPEHAEKRSVRSAIDAGFSRVFLTLLDTHVAALISAAFLFQFGTGPIRGFAVTLSVGLLVNLFTATFVSRTLFELALARRSRTALSI